MWAVVVVGPWSAGLGYAGGFSQRRGLMMQVDRSLHVFLERP